MTREQFRQYIKATDFKSLFIALGWNNYRNTFADFEEEFDGYTYSFRTVAQMKGYQVIVCDNAQTVTSSFCKRLDHKLRPNAQHYICIFTLPEENSNVHHVWAFPIRKTEKRDMVLFEYRNLDQTELLFQKLGGLTFGINEQATITIADVRDRIYGEFEVNSEKLTKDFYTGFRKQHTAFCEFITGINDHIPAKSNREKQWYASVMLNRLMFCYFIQKKGFLDGDPNYLKNKLGWCQMLKGNGQFYSFYRSFLLQLFFGGLNTPKHNADFENEFGQIPYLNGGMFDKHDIEKQFDEINIPDEAFEQLFKFFDQWNWHLDTRITASGRDINPDVLGYIFEQYINDRAQMGAYYTKEDITEYIGKNCILPFLMDRLAEKNPEAFKPDGYVWQTLRNSGDKYIYDAVKKGVADWDAIPQEIADGIDTTQPDLLARRAHWNDRTPLQWGLPTEIWRETIERLQRCRDLQRKISNGEITHINDFITYNLDIRQFVQDLLEKTDDHLFLLHFNEALLKVTILDPTCGSGAFLFAAMNILEPLYETCVYRMKEFNEHNPNLFKANLEELHSRYRSNIQYYIYKTIILHNLYGVDIMHEATEIAKLRLFLKMVAVVDVDFSADNLGLDPLPDIDFNIRCGNTLVGYATEKQLDIDLQYGDMFANLEFKEKIDTEMQKVAKTFERFRQLQLSQDAENMQAFKDAKQELNDRLAQLNDLLNRRLYTSTTGNILTKGKEKYNAFLASHQPFHWLAEYYQIIHGNGGFDVIIGNPPYVSMADISYLKNSDVFRCSDLYGFVIKRVFEILRRSGKHGFVVMHNLAFSRNFKDVRKLLLSHVGSQWYSFYSRIPSGLFSGDVRVRNCIYIVSNTGETKYTSQLNRWFTEQRDNLFISQYNYHEFAIEDSIPMLYDTKLQLIYENKEGVPIGLCKDSQGRILYYKGVGYNFLSISSVRPPAFRGEKEEYVPIGEVKFKEDYYKYLQLLFCGKFYLSKWLTYGDDFHVTSDDVMSFVFPFDKISTHDRSELEKLYNLFTKKLPKTVQYKLNAGINIGTFNTSLLWSITDQSDMIFYKYLCDDPEEVRELIENHLAKCVISDKK